MAQNRTYNCYQLTGLHPNLMRIILGHVTPHLPLEEENFLKPEERVLLVLHFIRSGHTETVVGKKFGVSPVDVSEEIHTIIPILFRKIRVIHLFGSSSFLQLAPQQIGETEVHGVITSCTHPRVNTQNESDSDDDDDDDDCDFLRSRVVTNFAGLISSVYVEKGNHEDEEGDPTARMALSMLDAMYVVGDGTVRSPRVEDPVAAFVGEERNRLHELCSVADNAIATTRFYRESSQESRFSLSLHTQIVLLTFQLCQLKFMMHPLSPKMMPDWLAMALEESLPHILGTLSQEKFNQFLAEARAIWLEERPGDV